MFLLRMRHDSELAIREQENGEQPYQMQDLLIKTVFVA